MDDFREKIIECNFLKNIQLRHVYKNMEIQNGSYLFFHFYKDVDFHQLLEDMQLDIHKAIMGIYWEDVLEIHYQTKVKHKSISKSGYKNIYLNEKYWRHFIDEMKSPVFIDNVPRLDSDLLYWYQKNKIFKKKGFLKKYLAYT